MDATIRRKYACRDCGHWELHDFFAVVASNGIRQVRGRCTHCGRVSGENENLKYAALHYIGIDPSTLPVREDVLDHHNHPCEVCENPYTEWHHWAPRAVFGLEAERFPGSWLCIRCHHDWHRRMSGYYWTQPGPHELSA